jgi:hypothetical protein
MSSERTSIYTPGTSAEEVEAREKARMNGRLAQYHRQRALAEKKANNAKMLVALAREQTSSAIEKLVDLMNGKPNKAKTINRDGEEVEIDIPIPPAVQLRAAEVILERGWGKSPQAMLLQTEEKTADGVHAMPIMQRIIAIKAAREQQGSTIDLEAAAARLTDEDGFVRDEQPDEPMDVTPTSSAATSSNKKQESQPEPPSEPTFTDPDEFI